ncbi:SGNH/GDSL hydrolase family protein [Paenibacillus psychroresistens]|uniref:SGNH/GDSL hydrolase family protein n=1 Tax=Paenibacillus psychroresistens TaxID=1778678 RepID=A0A6B8RQ78_9BACL|nr:SGNH/GDSL hydrolase family protein [Paenibacillus psychroresistens]QGQ97695.1 SGNH/GDSL hydrolase family protein [Paenibacillus psychroresistens]
MKRRYKIACLGDSMTAFWGSEMSELSDSLEREFPEQPFELFNYGVSGTRAEYGIYRITHDFPNPFGSGFQKCLSSVSPDLVVVESFAYNHRLDGKHNIDNYHNVLRQLFEVLRKTTPAQLVFLITIPPDRVNFLDHVPTYLGVIPELRQEWATYSEMYLQAAVEFAKNEQLTHINVFERVKDKVASGVPISWFIDQNDHIHPSRYAYEFISEEIVGAIQQLDLIK